MDVSLFLASVCTVKEQGPESYVIRSEKEIEMCSNGYSYICFDFILFCLILPFSSDIVVC